MEKQVKSQRSQKARDLWPQSDALRMGTNWSEGDLDKLQILVDDVWGESHPGSVHLDRLSRDVAIGVWESGGRPVHFHVTDICDGWAQGHDGMNYILASRETMADMVELHGSVWPWDGMVLISSCDKSIPAHLMAAARLDLPAVHVPGGSMRPGPRMSNSILGDCSTRKKEGTISEEEVRSRQRTAAPTCGACQFMGTASTMQCMAEALGLALPGSALAPATMAVIQNLARQAGQAVIRLAEKGITASQILTGKAFENAVAIHAAIGGSTNATLHLPAVAAELGLELPLEVFDRYNRLIPHLAWVQPSGPYPSEAFWFAGGIPLVQWYIKDYLHLDVMTATGKTLGENLAELEAAGYFEQYLGFLHNYGINRDDVITPPPKAKMKGSIAVLYGNLAPEGAVIKYSAVEPEMMVHKGPARVFDSEEDCCGAVTEGKVRPGDVLIIRYEGPCGSGMPEMLMTTEALVIKPELAKTTALVTDGRFSGGTRGPCIGHVQPEAVEGGPIALVEDGDIIEINIPERQLNIVGIAGNEVSAEEVAKVLEVRKQGWTAPAPRFTRGVMAKMIAKQRRR
ncbi:dihydroxy-acid dehydratase [Thermanaerosceptrum fracticalcis]|uniref:Dihydroxy-acid dehydratase n=1 Tax=Thermanaerosceptrum fracticalcis TaxID=1712410 RepID=A0A7G6E4D4_THEFR|nr:dihydroxy-acid dehydratase [Thermanaerosceptrum fracticalcis]QNB46938.1 dihydroxy-acid dehydratase [Thermanaerosceptrum fracticalcis]